MRKILILFITAVLLSGCATYTQVILESERSGIPQGYRIDPQSIYRFEFIVHSDPRGAEVWENNMDCVFNNKPNLLLGQTPLAIPVYIKKGKDRTWGKYFPAGGNFCLKPIYSFYWSWTVRKEGYYDLIINKELIPNIAPRQNVFVELGRSFNGISFKINCPLILLPANFDEQITILIKHKKSKEAEDLKNRQVASLKEAIEREGLKDDYIKELKRLKAMGNLAEPKKAEPKEDLSKDIARLKEDLDKAIKAGDYDKASKIKELIEYNEKNKPDESLKGINEEAIKYNNEGLAYARQKYYDDAAKSFKKAIETDPIYVDPYLNLSYCYIYLGNAQEAINYAEKALKLKPDSSLAFYYMGIAYDFLGNHPLAVEKYQKTLAECAAGECNDDFMVRIKKEGIEGGLFNSIQAARARASQSSSSQGFDWGDLLLGALLVGSSVNSGK